MKFAAALSLGIAPLALAKAVHNVYPVRRDPNKHAKTRSFEGSSVSGASLIDPLLLAEAGLVLGSQTEVILIWFNGGGGVPTSTINAQLPFQTSGSIGVGGQQIAPGGAVQSLAPLGSAPGQVAPVGAVGATQALGSLATPVAGVNGAQQTHVVTLGGPKGLIFEPDTIKANIGDMVIFTYLSQNHTATQSAFDTPCQPLAGGMDSGYQANPNNTVNPPPQVAMQVMVDTPLWFFCRQNGHCGKGMTFSINPSAAKTQAMFQAMAIAQNGQGGGSAITGNGGGAPPVQEAPGSTAAGTSLGELPAASGTLAQLPGETLGAIQPGGTGAVAGVGTLQPDGSCACAVECGSGSFPAVQAQGLGSFGGQAGALPQTMVAVR